MGRIKSTKPWCGQVDFELRIFLRVRHAVYSLAKVAGGGDIKLRQGRSYPCEGVVLTPVDGSLESDGTSIYRVG